MNVDRLIRAIFVLALIVFNTLASDAAIDAAAAAATTGYYIPLGPITENFQTWLDWRGYGIYNFSRSDLGLIGSFGGKDYDSQAIINQPVVFIHGNSDGALTDGSKYGTGWTKSIEYFVKQGYSKAELYATTWGNRNASYAYLRTHSCVDILRLRKFVEAVLQYTNVSKISVISHSMGVGMARKVIRGGQIEEPDGNICDIGDTLRHHVEVFIGISGANYGMCQCGSGFNEGPPPWPTCNAKTGFWPGPVCSEVGNCTWYHTYCQNASYSQLLQEMNEDSVNEADHVFAYWSHDDELIGNHDQVFGRPTSYVPFNNGTTVFQNLNTEVNGSEHMATKDKTTALQYNLVKRKSFIK